MPSMRRLAGLCLIATMLVGCGGSRDVVSKGPIQKRKYRPGWAVDIGGGHPQREASPRRMTSRAIAVRPAEEPIEQVPLQGSAYPDLSDEPLAMVPETEDQGMIIARSPCVAVGMARDMSAPPLSDDRPLNKLAPTALAVVVGGVLLSFLLDTGTFFIIGIIAGFVLALIALGQIKRRNESGEGYGIAALVLSTVGIAVMLIAFVALVTYSAY